MLDLQALLTEAGIVAVVAIVAIVAIVYKWKAGG